MRLQNPSPQTSWVHAALRAALMIVLSFVAFVLVPNTLLGYLSTRLVPNWRDLAVVAFWAFAFLGCCVFFVRVQRGRVS